MGVESFSVLTVFNMVKMLVSQAFSVWLDFAFSFFTHDFHKRKTVRLFKKGLSRLF